MGLFRSRFLVLSMNLKLFTFVVFLSELLLFPAHFFIVLFFELKLIFDVLDIDVDGFECL